MHLLICDSDEEVRELIRLLVESEFEAEVHLSGDVAESRRILSSEDIACVISGYEFKDGNAKEILDALRKKRPGSTFILCSSHNPKIDSDEYVAKPWIVDPLRLALAKNVKRKAAAPGAAPDSVFCRVPLPVLVKFGMLGPDLYLRLGDEKYVKVFRADDIFDGGDLERFAAKNIDALYVSSRDAQKFIAKLADNLHAISTMRDVPAGPAFQISSEATEIMNEASHKLGFSYRLGVLAKASVQVVVASLRNNAKFGDLIKKIEVDPKNYLATHSVAHSFVACGLSSLMGWESETTFFKLSLAGILHDLPLEDPELARIHFLKDLGTRRNDPNDPSVRAVLDHPREAARFLDEIPDAPSDVDQILAQHHERPDGTGFPEALNYLTIAPLAALFIVAQDLLDFFQASNFRRDLTAFVTLKESEYDKGHFKKILRALQEKASSSE